MVKFSNLLKLKKKIPQMSLHEYTRSCLLYSFSLICSLHLSVLYQIYILCFNDHNSTSYARKNDWNEYKILFTMGTRIKELIV